jgi:hypothetical protein
MIGWAVIIILFLGVGGWLFREWLKTQGHDPK